MIPRGISKRYATALLNAALKSNIAGEVNEDAIGFRKLLTDHPDFKNFLLSPQVLTEDKQDIIKTALEGKASDVFLRFLLLLIDKKRFPFIEGIIEAYGALFEKHEGLLEVKVITAHELSDDGLIADVRKKLESQTGKKIKLVPSVDPKIIGGMVLIMEDKIIDGSIRFKMEKLKRELDEVRVQ